MNIWDDPEVKEAMKERGIKKPRKARKTDFSKDKVRTYAIKTLSVLAELDQRQRDRVLEQAQKLNKI